MYSGSSLPPVLEASPTAQARRLSTNDAISGNTRERFPPTATSGPAVVITPETTASAISASVTARDRFKAYDDIARNINIALSKRRRNAVAHVLAFSSAMIALVVFDISSGDTQLAQEQTQTAYFHFITALAVLTIVNSIVSAANALIEYAQLRAAQTEVENEEIAEARGAMPTVAQKTEPTSLSGTKLALSPALSPAVSQTPTPTNGAVKMRVQLPTTSPSSPSVLVPTSPAAPVAAVPTRTIYQRIVYYTSPRIVLYLEYCHLILSVIVFIMYFVALIAQSALWNSDTSTIHRAGALRYWLIVTTAVNTVATAVISLNALNAHWQMPAQFARSVLFLSSLLLIGSSIVIVILNVSILRTSGSSGQGLIPAWCFDSMQWMGVYCFVTGCHGIFIIFTVAQNNKERRIYRLLITIFTRLSIGAAVCCIVFTVVLLVYWGVTGVAGNPRVDQLINTDPPIACGLCILSIVSIIAAYYLLAAPSSGLRVERIDLSGTSPELLTHWATQIDAHNHGAEGLTGGAAIELMKLYSQNTLSSVHCVVLRIRRAPVAAPNTANSSTTEHRQLLKRIPEAVGADFECVEQDEEALDRERELEARVTAAIAASSPRGSRLGFGKSASFSFIRTATPRSATEPVMSIKEQKKAAKKEKKKQAKAAVRDGKTTEGEGETGSLPPHLHPDHAAVAAQRAAEKVAAKALRKMIADDDTEALIMVSVVDEYDVTTQVKGWLGRLLTRTLGAEGFSFFRPLVLRLGLIGFQWPFRTSVFFLQPSPHPAGRAAACLRAVLEWNEAQSSGDRCDLMLLPAMKIQTALAAAVEPAGFFRLALPPSHMQDMRWHHRATATWQDYLRTLNRSHRKDLLATFSDAGGHIIEADGSSWPMNETAINDVYRLWKNIATRRTEDLGETATFASPNAQFLTEVSATLSTPHRSFLFLMHDGEIIASCVLFKFPNKVITSDLQGLDHAKARPLRAYFVMMQWVIRYALQNGYNYVDFGPTTGQAKIDMGCAVYELAGGGYARNSLLGYAMKTAAKNVQQSLALAAAKDNKQEKEKAEREAAEALVGTLTSPPPLSPPLSRYGSANIDDGKLKPPSFAIDIRDKTATELKPQPATASSLQRKVSNGSHHLGATPIVHTPPSPSNLLPLAPSPTTPMAATTPTTPAAPIAHAPVTPVSAGGNSGNAGTATLSKTQQRKLANLAKQQEIHHTSTPISLAPAPDPSKPLITPISGSSSNDSLSAQISAAPSESKANDSDASPSPATSSGSTSVSAPAQPPLSKTQQRKLAKQQKQRSQSAVASDTQALPPSATETQHPVTSPKLTIIVD